jgi:predicted ATPase/DNA-binding SARP family transcriptional activator
VHVIDEVFVETDGARIPVGGPRARALIARLVLERGRTLSLDVLIEELWESPSDETRTTLRAYMSRLRRSPLGSWLRGGRSGYRLDDGLGLEADIWTVQDAVAGHSAPNAAQLTALLDGWRDAPLQGIGEPPFVQAARGRIRGTVDAAHLLVARADLEGGRVDRALASLQSLRLRHPDDEDLLALLRLAQGRGGPDGRAFARIASAAAATPAPPVRGAGSTPMIRRSGIPAPIAGMVGRREERAALTAALDVARLVTVTGAAGVGKTRLAVDWLGSDAVTGEEHVWFVGLGGSDDERVAGVIASAVGAPVASPEDIGEHLADRRGILVIDGADAAIDGVVAVAVAVLTRARGLAVLSTSRSGLGVPGESVLRIEPLPAEDARALFRARRTSSTTEGEEAAVSELVEKLGRLPLAVELAAARAAVMPLDDVAESMLRDIGPGADGGGPPLAAALRASLDLLSTEQRETLRSVSRFAGPFTRESVAAVSGKRPRDADLDRLVASSLVSAETSVAGPVFRVAGLVRRAAGDGEDPDDEWSLRHRRWFAERAARASLALTARDSVQEVARLRSEWPDLNAAFDSAERAGDRTVTAAIAGGLLWFAVRAGRQREVLELTRRALSMPGSLDLLLDAQLRMARGFLAYQLGSMSEAATWIRSARSPAEEAGDPEARGLAIAFSAYLRTLGPEKDPASRAEIAAALELVDAIPDAAASMVTLIAGQVQRASGRGREAIDLLEHAGARAERCGHDWVALMAPVVTAKVHIDLRQGAAAIATLRSVVRRGAEQGDPVSVLIAASVAAGAAALLGEDAAGARIIGAVDAIGRRYGFDPRANEPVDFELYRRRVREGLTLAEWRSASAHGERFAVAELIDVVESLAPVR